MRRGLFGFGLALVACSSSDPGSVDFEIIWEVPEESRPTGTDGLFLFTFVVFPPDEQVGLRPEPYRPPTLVSLDGVPNGRDRRLRLELRTTDQETSDLRFIGLSEPFVMESGVSSQATVRMDYAPEFATAVVADGIRFGSTDYVREAAITLTIDVRGADRLAIAQDAAFSVGSEAVSLDAEPPDRELPDGFRRFSVPYDLSPACGVDSCDGPKRIFLRAEALAGDEVLASGLLPDALPLVLDTGSPRIRSLDLTIEPPPGAGLVQPTAAATGSRVLYLLSASEAWSEPPALSVRSEAGDTLDFEFVPGASGFASARFEAVVGPDTPEGRYVPTITIRDLAGNVAVETLAERAVEVLPGPLALVVDQASVSYVRSDAGSTSARAFGEFTLPPGPYFALAPPDPYEPTATLPLAAFQLRSGSMPRAIRQLRVWSDPQKTTLLGALEPTAEGWPRTALLALDTGQVFVTGLDAAGNESAPVPLENGWYIATTAGGPESVPAEFFDFFDATPRGVPEGGAPAGPALGGMDGVADDFASKVRWTRADAGYPAPWFAYDPRRDRLFRTVEAAGIARMRVEEWSGEAWVEQFPDSLQIPSATNRYGVAYDARRERLVIFGGERDDFSVLTRNTWAWDGTDWFLINGSKPVPRERASTFMAYDPVRDAMVLFGGESFDDDGQRITRSDVWEHDGADWDEVTPSGTGPEYGDFFFEDGAFFFHPGARSVQLIARMTGRVPQGTATDQLERWEWDGTAWRLTTPAALSDLDRRPDGSPRGGQDTRVVFDPQTLAVYLSFVSSGEAPEIYRFDGAEVERIDGLPGAPRQGLQFFDPLRGVPVGEDASGRYFGFDGSAFFEVGRTRDSTPEPRRGASVVYDPTVERTLISGGQAVDDTPLFDTWSWDGLSWSLVSTSSTGMLRGDRQVYDPVRSRLYGFGGGQADELPTWERTESGWRQLDVAVGPDARTAFGVAFSDVDEDTLLFGGTNAAAPLLDGWTFDGTTWSRVFDGPEARSGHGMTYDASRAAVLLFGGTATDGTPLFDRIWQWSSGAWSSRVPAGPGPQSRDQVALVYFDALERTLLYGGLGEGAVDDQVWAWDGAAWSTLGPVTGRRPPSQTDNRLVVDERRGRVVNLGGRFSASPVDGVWELDVPERPAFQFRAQLPADVPLDALTAVEVEAYCAGAGADEGTAGAQLLIWQNGSEDRSVGWALLDEHTSGPEASPDAARLEASIQANAGRVVSETSRELAVQCRPVPGTAGLDSTVAVDYIEVRLGYARRP